MKLVRTILLTAIMLTTLQSTCNGQRRIMSLSAGMRFGGNLGSIHLTDRAYGIYQPSSSLFPQAGVWLQFRTPAGISLRPEISYKGRGGTLTCRDVRYHLVANTIDARLCMQLDFYVARTMSSFYLVAAPAYVHTLGGHVDYSDDFSGELDMSLSASNFTDNDFELFCGAGFEFPIPGGGTTLLVSVEAGYNFTLADSFTDVERSRTLITLNHTDLSETPRGSRLFRGFEIAARVGIPFGRKLKILR